MESKKVTLILQDEENNHDKYYNMAYLKGDDEFVVTYGRIGSSTRIHRYPVEKWNSQYRSKIKKGYTDVSDLPMAVGSPVVCSENKLCLITEVIEFRDNAPHRVWVENERNVTKREYVENINPGYLKPGTLTHDAFYPNLIKLQKSLLSGSE